MICKYCGHAISDDAIYCKRCGEVLSGDRPRTVLREEIPSHLAGAILVTILCCWPFGIPAIFYAARVNDKLIHGDYKGAREDSQNAKSWIICSIVGAALLVFLLFFSALMAEFFP